MKKETVPVYIYMLNIRLIIYARWAEVKIFANSKYNARGAP